MPTPCTGKRPRHKNRPAQQVPGTEGMTPHRAGTLGPALAAYHLAAHQPPQDVPTR